MDGKCYKVCDIEDGKYTSSMATGRWILRYKVGKVTKPRIGGCFVFRTLQSAKRFKPVCDVIFEGVGTNLRRMIIMPAWLHDWLFIDFWKKGLKSLCENDKCSTPIGTYICDSFKPIKLLS